MEQALLETYSQQPYGYELLAARLRRTEASVKKQAERQQINKNKHKPLAELKKVLKNFEKLPLDEV